MLLLFVLFIVFFFTFLDHEFRFLDSWHGAKKGFYHENWLLARCQIAFSR